MKSYEKACDGGKMMGCSNLGASYAMGTGVPQDYGKAAALYEKACTGGDAGGCFNRGILYHQGTGVRRT